MSRYFYGMMTTENVEEIAGTIKEVLGDKFYTTVCTHPVMYPKIDDQHPEQIDCRVDIRTSQKLDPKGTRNGKAIDWSIDDGRAHLTIYDSYGLYCLDSKLSDKHARNDGTYKNPYFVFKGDQFTVWHRAPAGNLLVWSFAAEDHAE